MFSDAIEALKSYAASQNLTPAFGGVVDGKIGNNTTPPSYQQAIALQVSTNMLCYVQSVDLRNPGVVQCKTWIHGLWYNPQIGHAILRFSVAAIYIAICRSL